MVLGRVLRYAIDRSGAYLIPRAYQAFRKYDVQTTNRLFGKSGGKGFRHGRDLGLILGEYVGDDLDESASGPESTSSKFRQARYRYKRSSSRSRNKRDRCICYRGQSKRYYQSGTRRF